MPVTSTGVFKSTVSSPSAEVKLIPVKDILASAVVVTPLILSVAAIPSTIGPTSIVSVTCPTNASN